MPKPPANTRDFLARHPNAFGFYGLENHVEAIILLKRLGSTVDGKTHGIYEVKKEALEFSQRPKV